MTDAAPAAPVKRRDFPAWRYVVSLIVIVLIGILPILITLVAVGIASANGCQVDESSVHPCILGGIDHGADIQAASFAAFLFLVSGPVAFVLFLIWLVIFIIHLVRFGNARKAALAQ